MSEEQVEEVVAEERDWLSEAKVLGYHDPAAEDYKGDPEKALTPEEFVKRGEEILPIVNANNKKLQAQIKKQSEDFDKEKAEFKNYMDSTLKRERADHARQLKEAEDDEDIVRYKNLVENPPAEPVEQKVSPVEKLFGERNDWYGVDDERTRITQAADRSLEALRDGALSPEAYVKRLEEEVERLMPTKPAHNTVVSSRKKPISAKSKTFEAMPKEFQAACKKMEKGNWGIERGDYVKNYFDGLEE